MLAIGLDVLLIEAPWISEGTIFLYNIRRNIPFVAWLRRRVNRCYLRHCLNWKPFPLLRWEADVEFHPYEKVLACCFRPRAATAGRSQGLYSLFQNDVAAATQKQTRGGRETVVLQNKVLELSTTNDTTATNIRQDRNTQRNLEHKP
jgi:hypothetical protein